MTDSYWSAVRLCGAVTGHGGRESRLIDYVWTVVTEMSLVERAKLLQFWTGSACVPSDMSHWNLKLEVGRPSEKLPNSATCFRTIYIPAYPTLEKTREKLLRAIQETSFLNA